MQENSFDAQRWCVPFYLKFLHGNFISPEMHNDLSQDQWNCLVRDALHDITPEIAGDLLTDANWRAKLPGAWFCGLKNWDDFTLDIGRALVRHNYFITSQGYSFALARFASHASASFLCTHLNRVLQNLAGDSDSDWCVGALLWIDEQLSTHYADDYVGLWLMAAQRMFDENDGYAESYRLALTPEAAREKMWRIMAYVEENFDAI